MNTERKSRADAFRALHVRGTPIVLYNAWDAGSARAVAAAGADAIATGSWSVAAANGWDDGEQVPLDFALANAARIAAAVVLPLTIDLESGYASDAAGVGATVVRAIEAGAIGCNLEDRDPASNALRAPEEQALRLASARRSADATGVPLFVNARTDVFLVNAATAHDDSLVAAALERAQRYADVGADGLFVPGLVDLRLIARVVEGSPLPVNVMARPGLPSRRELADAGVARISYGPAPYRQLMERLTEAARAAIAGGTGP